MVFISSVDVTFSWLVSTPILRWVAMVVHIFLVDDEWIVLVIVNDYSWGYCARSYVHCLALLFSGLYLCSEGVGVFDWVWRLLWLALVLGGVWSFAIEKLCVLFAALQSFKLGVCHPYGLIWGGACALSCIMYTIAFLLHFLHIHLSHFASPDILACICLIMLVTVLGWVVMRCDTLLLDHAR
jgi:hypothetical protein